MAKKSCHNVTAVVLRQNQFYSIGPYSYSCISGLYYNTNSLEGL